MTYDFALRHGVTFQNRDPFTAEDVQFSFERYKGASAVALKQQVKAIEIVDPHHVRFVLHEPWPDFLTFYATTATTAGWIVPKHYTEKIGNDTFKQHPVGLGPYRLVRYDPGIETALTTPSTPKRPHLCVDQRYTPTPDRSNDRWHATASAGPSSGPQRTTLCRFLRHPHG